MGASRDGGTRDARRAVWRLASGGVLPRRIPDTCDIRRSPCGFHLAHCVHHVWLSDRRRCVVCQPHYRLLVSASQAGCVSCFRRLRAAGLWSLRPPRHRTRRRHTELMRYGMANQVSGANRRPASPFDAGRQFGRASCAPPSLSAAVAHFCR